MKEIPLTQGKVALVDDEDYPRLSQFKWYAVKDQNQFYAARKITVGNKRRHLYMHQAVMNVAGEVDVNHDNQNGLDDRKTNLAIDTHRASHHSYPSRRHNLTGFHGVTLYAGKYNSMINGKGVNEYLGRFESASEAATVYDVAARRYFGRAARLNFPGWRGFVRRGIWAFKATLGHIGDATASRLYESKPTA